MKAAVLEELNMLVVRNVPDPEVDDYSAVMKVESVSICGSDVRIFRHGNPRVKPPTNVPRRAKAACSGGDRRLNDQSMDARTVQAAGAFGFFGLGGRFGVLSPIWSTSCPTA